MQKAKDRYHNCGGKEKAAEYYLENSGVLKEKAKNKCGRFSEEQAEGKRKYRKNRYKNIKKKRKLKMC